MIIAPVLLLGYNRPEQMAGLIKSLEPHKPKLILVSVDGPRESKPSDAELVKQTQETLSLITWDAQVLTRFRDSNLGLRKAVVDAVNWATDSYGHVVVLEDDVRAGPELLDYMNFNLEHFKLEEKIAHINGYNLVPVEYLSRPSQQSRLSIYPESYAWATWHRAWKKYDDDLTWAKSASIEEIKLRVGTTFGALRWKQNFSDAYHERIDTWAYRWLASMWEHNLLMVSPNRNIAKYEGWEKGTHTFQRIKIKEQGVASLSSLGFNTIANDKTADAWLASNIFSENMAGCLKGLIVTFALKLIRIFK